MDTKLRIKSNQWDFHFEETEVEKKDVYTVEHIANGRKIFGNATITKNIPPVTLTFIYGQLHMERKIDLVSLF